jgi:hypothetical protein
MVRAVGNAAQFGTDQTLLDLVADWHAPIGKAVLENWGFAEEMCNAVGDQDDPRPSTISARCMTPWAVEALQGLGFGPPPDRPRQPTPSPHT